MKRAGFQPDHFTFASVLSACAKLEALRDGKETHDDIIISGFHSDVVVGNALIDVYAKCHGIEDACGVFDKISQRNVVSRNAMIAGYVQNGDADQGGRLFKQMPERNVVSWNTIIAGYAQYGHVDNAAELFRRTPDRNAVSYALIAG